jgi:hypothetical protein
MKKIVSVGVVATGVLVVSCALNKPNQVATVNPAKVTPEATNRLPTSEDSEESPWTTWSKKGTVGGLYVLRGIRENLLKIGLNDPHVDYSSYEPVDCAKQNTKFRSADGTCNNLRLPNVGAAGVAFGRNVAPEFIDHDAEEKLMTPNPALVSQEFFTRDEFKEVPFLNMLAASWIQFMNHDWLTHGPNATENPHRVPMPDGTEVLIDRTKERTSSEGLKRSYGKVTNNDVTHWWDGSQIYGSSEAEQNRLRTFAKGKMITVRQNGRELLPRANDLNPANNRQNHGYEDTGFRDNWWVGLSMLHHLFVMEHNAIAEMLMKKHVTFDEKSKKWIWNQAGLVDRIGNTVRTNGRGVFTFNDKELDEHVFQTARLINAAVMAKIHTVEWTPAILPNKVLKKAMYTNWYGLANPVTWSKLIKNIPGMKKADWFTGVNTGYTIGGIVGDKTNDYGVPYSITEEFTSVYRLHSLLPEKLYFKKLDKQNDVVAYPFEATRNEKSYGLMANHDLKDLFYSFGTQKPGQLVLNNFPKFMQELTIPGHGKMDLAMVDVVRDRERGVPRYNQFRRGIGLKPIQKYADFFPDGMAKDARQEAIIAKFNTVYGKDAEGKDNVEAIDLLVGTSAEEVRPKNFGFGETLFHIFVLMASRRLMADRFYTADYTKEYYTKAGLDWIDDEGYMAKVIIRHMPELAPKLEGLETAFNPWRN